jgi:hypothetical protein
MQNNNQILGISDYQKYINYLNSQNNQIQIINKTQPVNTKQIYTNKKEENDQTIYEMSPSVQENKDSIIQEKKEISKNRRLYIAFTIILWIASVISLLFSTASIFIFYGIFAIPFLNLIFLFHILKTFLVPKKRVYSIVSTILSISFIFINVLGFVLGWVYFGHGGLARFAFIIYDGIFIIFFTFHIYLMFQDIYILLKEDF